MDEFWNGFWEVIGKAVGILLIKFLFTKKGLMVTGAVLGILLLAHLANTSYNFKDGTNSENTEVKAGTLPTPTKFLDPSLRLTPEQTIENFYALTTQDSKAAGQAFTNDNFKKKYPSSDKNKEWVKQFNFIKVTKIEPINQSKDKARINLTCWLIYSFKNGSEDACEYRNFTIVRKNNEYFIDDIGEATKTSCP